MSDRLREAIVSEDWDVKGSDAVLPWRDLVVLIAAARRFLALTETGIELDWKAAYAERDHQIGPELDDVAVQQIVKAAVECSLCGRQKFLCDCAADYLTEED